MPRAGMEQERALITRDKANPAFAGTIRNGIDTVGIDCNKYAKGRR